jgi:phosphate-selective porin
MRKISGAYAILTQDLGTLPFTAIVKYDFYNPNTEVSGNDIKAAGSGTDKGDITINTIGLGLMWRINPALRLTAYYDIVSNETTENLKDKKDDKGKITQYGWENDRKDNVFTLRLQYKF